MGVADPQGQVRALLTSRHVPWPTAASGQLWGWQNDPVWALGPESVCFQAQLCYLYPTFPPLENRNGKNC